MSQDAGLFWDNTNKRLGIGTVNPAEKLDVAGNVKLTGHIIGTDGTCNPTNLLSNGDFGLWSAGTSVAPDDWVLEKGESIIRESSIVKLGTYSAKLTNDADLDAYLTQSFISPRGLDYWKDRKITLSAWVWSDTPNRVRIYMPDENTFSSYHPGDSTWHLLTLTHLVPSSPTYIKAYIYIDTGTRISIYLDGAMAVEGDSIFSFSDKPLIIGNNLSTIPVTFGGNVSTSGIYKVDDVQVVSNRVIDSRISNTPNSGDATTDDLIDAMRDALLTHGLMAAS
jgi:hypothetical protein